MKKRILLALLSLVIALSAFSVVAMAGDADEEAQATGCTVKTENITSQGTISTPQTFWAISDHINNLVDGDYSTGAGSECKTRGTNRFLDFGSPRNITLVRIYVNYDGNANVSDDSNLSAIKNQDKNFIFVAHPGEQSGSNRLCQLSFNTKDKTYVEFTSEDWKNEPFQTVEIWNDGYYSDYIIYEIEVYAETGSHAWVLDSTTTPPTCTAEGAGTYKCECGATKDDVIEPTGHNPNNAQWIIDTTLGTHYNACLNGCGIRLNEEEHQYDNVCDSICDFCGQTRVVEGHEYTSDCDIACDKCNTTRTAPKSHTYSADCVAECSDCKFERTNVAEHKWDNACDNKCDVCGLERSVPDHEYDTVCDDICGVCGFKREDAEPHEYKKKCSTNCSVCKLARENPSPHTYSNACDPSCNECGLERAVPDHVYDNLCDAICDECSHKRNDALTDHVFANDCDPSCNECGATRTASKHIYGKWIERLAPTTERAGQKYQQCISCGEENIEEIPPLEIEAGLSKGALIAIIVSSSVVVIGGCTGIGVYSMVIKPKMAKKKLEALEAQKKAEAEADAEDLDDDDEYDDDEDYEDEEDDDTQE